MTRPTWIIGLLLVACGGDVGSNPTEETSDASTEAGPCAPGAHRCDGNDQQACVDGAWTRLATCPGGCLGGACVGR